MTYFYVPRIHIYRFESCGNSSQNHNAKQPNLAPTADLDLDASTLSPTPSGQNLRAFPRAEDLS